MNRSYQRPVQPENLSQSHVWLISFSDLLTLLLAFFVLRFSMSSMPGSNPVPNKIQTPVISGIETAPVKNEIVQRLTGSFGKPETTEITNNGEKIRAAAFTNGVQVYRAAEKTHVVVTNGAFATNSDELTFRGAEILQALGHIAAEEHLTAFIADHSASDALNTIRFPSEWELSASRAAVALRQMIDAGVDPHAISAAGYGNSKPMEIGGSGLPRVFKSWIEIELASPANKADQLTNPSKN